MAFEYVPGVNTYTTNTTGTGTPGGSGNTGNNSGSSGTLGNQFLTDLVENLNTDPRGYTGSRSQADNTGNVVLTPAEELRNIVNQRSTLANQAGIPKYLTNKFKHLFPQGDVPYADMTGQQRAIADFYAGSTPNAYQQAIQNFMDASPENMDIYKKSGLKGAGLNAFMTTVPEALAERSLLGQGLKAFTGLAENVFDKLGTAYSAGKEKVGNMMDAGADIFSPDTLGKPGDDFLNMSQAEYDAYRKNKLAQLPKKNQSAPGSNPLAGILSLNTSTDTVGNNFLADMLANMNLNTSTGTSNAEVVSPTVEQSNKKRDSKLDYKAPFFDLAYTLSPTVGDFRENLAGTEPYEQPVLDFAMGRAPEIYKTALETFKNKYPNQSPLDYVGMLDRLQSTPNFPRTLMFNENFLPSAQTPVQFNNGGLASLNNRDYGMLMNASNFGF